MQKRPWLVACLLAACSLWHGRMLWLVFGLISGETAGGDFASYYYAVQAAADGGNPYDVVALNTLAGRDPSKFFSVQPYFYPPPFLLLLCWAPKFSLPESLRVWFWLSELALVGIFVQLLVWWRRLYRATDAWLIPAALALVFTGSTFAVNLSLGQANLFVMLAAISGLYCVENRRPVLGGTLVGLACMAKMSPALFVLWWCLSGRWRAVASACVAAIVSSVLALSIVDLETQLHFYSKVLPSFASGDYNGLRVPVGVMGNHSIPNIFHQFLSSGPMLSTAAQLGSRFTTLALLGWLGWMFRRPADHIARAAQLAVIAVAMIVTPIYAYEHHLVWAAPAFAIATLGIASGRLSKGWIAPLLIAWLAWATDPGLLREPYHALRNSGDGSPAGMAVFVATGLQELKFVAILTAGAAAFALASPATRESRAGPNCD